MGIELNNAPSRPAITYNRVHLVKLTILQEPIVREGTPPIYNVTVRYRLFGIDSDGVRVYLNAPDSTVNYSDFLGTAIMASRSGDLSMLTALHAVEGAIVAVINKETDSNATII